MPYLSLMSFNAIGILLIIIILVHNMSSHDFFLFDKRLLFSMLLSTLLMLILDSTLFTLTEYKGNLITYKVILVLFYILSVAPTFFWTLYTNYSLFNNKEKLRESLPLYLVPLVINTVLTLVSISKEVLFKITNEPNVERGEYFYITQCCSWIYIIFVVILVFSISSKVYRRRGYVLLSYALPPMASAIIQIFIPSLSLIWTCSAISCLIIFISTQSTSLSTDYLTKINNRLEFDEYLRDKLRRRGNLYLSVVMLDINKFKQINDSYGHLVGDKALIDMSYLLKMSIGKKDFIARYAGDEFIIITEASDSDYIMRVLTDLRINTAKYNLETKEEFVLSYSVGVYTLKPHVSMDFEEIVGIVDKKMYQNKEV